MVRIAKKGVLISDIFNEVYKNKFISDQMKRQKLSKKEYITSETDEYYRISSDWQEHIQNGLFHVIQLIISKEIEKPSPNFKKIAILNYFVSLVWYDYYMKK